MANSIENIALIGPRGVGKSKIAKRMSKLIQYPVISTDSIAVYELGGKTIPEYIQECNGNWKNFRDLEYKILMNLKNAKNVIIDCGGGILFDIDQNGEEIPSQEKINLLRSISTVVFLDNDVEKLVRKVEGDSTRPPLSSQESYEQILLRRLPIYKEACHYRLYLNNYKKEEAAKMVLKLVGF